MDNNKLREELVSCILQEESRYSNSRPNHIYMSKEKLLSMLDESGLVYTDGKEHYLMGVKIELVDELGDNIIFGKLIK